MKKYYFNIVILFFSLAVFIGTAENIYAKNGIARYDTPIISFIHNIALHYPTKIAFIITNMGIRDVWIVLPFFIILFLAVRKFKEAVLLLFTSLGGHILCNLIKDLFMRTRPAISTPVDLVGGYSFPSGHAVFSMCFYGTLIYLAFIYIENKWLKWLIIVFLSILIILVGFSRVYLGVHYPSDVIGGFSLGLFWLSLCVLVYKTCTAN